MWEDNSGKRERKRYALYWFENGSRYIVANSHWTMNIERARGLHDDVAFWGLHSCQLVQRGGGAHWIGLTLSIGVDPVFF